MKETDLVSTLTVKQISEGAAKVQADLKGTAAAQDQLAASSTKLAATSETSARRQASVASAFDNLERRTNPAARALAELERVQRTVNMALAQNPAVQDRASQVLDVYVGKVNALAIAQENARRQQANAAVNQGQGFNPMSANTSTYAAEFEKAAVAHEKLVAEQMKMAASSKAVKAAIDPLGTAFQKMAEDVAYFNKMQKEGLLTQQQTTAASAMAVKRYEDVAQSLKKAGSAGQVMSGEMVNLGYQLNDVVTGLMMGQSPFMILGQQGGQIVQIFSNSKASIADFARSTASWFAGLLTVGRGAFGGIATVVTGALLALTAFQGKQMEVTRQLAGAGRASGASAAGIDAIAQSNASLGGFSVTEARNLAAALAATGKVGVDAIGPIVKLGHDFAATYGVDAKEATEILAKAFADPAKGAEELNQRLGFLDASTKRLIESLVTQGNRQQAVKVLTDAIKGSIVSASEVTSAWGRVWNATSNAASDFFDRVGRGADRLFDGGANLNEKINNLTVELLELQKAKINEGFWTPLFAGNVDKRIADVTAELNKLAKQRTNLQPSNDTALKARGLEIDALARAAIPAADAEKKLTDQAIALNEAISNPALAKYVTVMGTDLVRAAERAAAAAAAVKNFDPVTNQIAEMEAQVSLLDKRTIADRAAAAAAAEKRRQENDPNAGTAEERLRKQGLAALAAAGGQTALDAVERQRLGTLGQMATVSDQVRMRQLDLNEANRTGAGVTDTQRKALLQQARDQAIGIDQINAQIDATKMQIATFGMSVGAATEFTAVETIRLQKMREGRPLQEAELALLREKAEVLGQVAQAGEMARVDREISFDRQTAFLSQEDVQIAQQLKGLFPDIATALKSPQAEAMRFNNTLLQVKASAETFASGFAKDIMAGVPAVKALENGLRNLASSLIDSAVKMLVDQALTSVAGALGGAAAGAGQAATMTAGATTAAGVLTAAGASVAAEIIAGATAAASILGLTIPTAAATLPVAGAVTGVEVAAGGVAAGASLAAGGAAAGTALWGPIALLAAAVAAIGLSSFLGGGDDDELRQAQDQWEGMTGQLKEFNRAASGFDLGPLTQEIESLRQSHDTLALAALKAGDDASVTAIHDTFNKGIRRIFSEWMNGVPVLGELSQKIQDLTNEARGLTEAIPDAAAAIEQGLIARINALKMAAEDALKSEINVAQGFGWLNDINAAIAKFNDLNGKVDGSLLNTWMTVTLQKIVDDAKLTGEAFNRLISGIPQIAGYIHEYSEALDESGQAALAAAAAQEKATLQLRLLVAQTDQTTLSGALAVNALRQQMEMNDAIAANSQNIVLLEEVHAAERLNIVQDFADRATKAAQDAADKQAQILKDAQATFEGFVRNIRDFIAHYLAGPESGLSPADQLANAQAAFNSQIVLAQGGDRDALNSITQYFTDLDKASKAFYASSSAGQAITGSALSQLEALPSQISPEQFIVNAIEATSVDQITAIEAMQTALSGVLTVGSPSANAAALLPFFQALNTTVDAGLTQTELIAGLGATYNTGTLRNIFAELDGNGNGILEKSELIKLATQGTKTATDAVDINTDSLPAQATTIAGMETNLLALAQISGNTANSSNGIATLALLLGNQSTSVGESARAMRLMMIEQNSRWRDPPYQYIPTYAAGTDFHPGGMALIGERGPEILNLPRGSQVIPNHVAFPVNDNARMPPQMSAPSFASFGGGDNSALIAEVRALRGELSEIKREMRRNTQVANVGHQGTHEKLEQANELKADENRRRRVQNRA